MTYKIEHPSGFIMVDLESLTSTKIGAADGMIPLKNVRKIFQMTHEYCDQETIDRIEEFLKRKKYKYWSEFIKQKRR